jgi:large subunit ribosomal protein L21
MYAVIRAGGKQYRVAPGDVIRVEKAANDNGRLEFTDDVLAVGNDGELGRKDDARVAAEVLGEVKGEKVLVFHYKRKKQYKKLQGHRQPYTAIRITEIAFDGQSFKAPEQPKREAKPKKTQQATAAEPAAVAAKPKASAKKSAAKKSAPAKKSTSKKK